MLKRLLLSAALIAWLAMPAYSQAQCTVRLPGGTVKPCVTAEAKDAGIADRALADMPQTGPVVNNPSYNCFFYVRTNVLGHRPAGTEGAVLHLTPANDYIDETFLTSHGYHLVVGGGDLGAAIYEPGDIVLVPGQDPDLPEGEQFKHAGIVYGTNNGKIVRFRQKYNAHQGVVDLTPAEFQAVFEPEAVGDLPAQYRTYRHPPFVGQTKVPTGTYRGRDGYVYATFQLIKIIVFSFTPDGEHLGPGPLNSRNGGLYVAAEGIFHRSFNGNSYQLLALYDAQGRARRFNQTIPLYTCSGGGTAC